MTTPNDTCEPHESGLLTVDLDALVANWRQLAAMAVTDGRHVECGAVVKADAYGLGQAPAMRALAAAGCRTYFVANLAEGELARSLAPEATIYVLDGVSPGSGPRLAAAGLRPALGSLAELDDWAATARALGRPLDAALHVDTGMNRLGLPAREADAAAARLAEHAGRVRLTLVMSHFVSSQKVGAPINARQIAEFETARRFFPDTPASMANSSAVSAKHCAM